MRTYLFSTGITLLIMLLSWGCRKDAGEGGNSSIRGVLYARNVYSRNATVAPDDYEADQKVYLSYGDKATYDDDYTTSYDGSFEFRYLRPGTYKLFVYTMDTLTMTKVPVVRTIELGTNEVQTVKDLVVMKDANNGNATIKGRVFVKDYNHTFEDLNTQFYSSEEDVYIIYGEGTNTYHDKTKTAFDGSFQFNKLRKGTYSVYVMSDDSSRKAPAKIPAIRRFSVTEKNQIIVLPDIIKFK